MIGSLLDLKHLFIDYIHVYNAYAVRNLKWKLAAQWKKNKNN